MIYAFNIYTSQFQSVNEIRTMFEDHHHIQQAEEEEIYCGKCGNAEGTFINLQCDHLFCILCAAFMYAKSRKLLLQEDSVKCPVCGNVTELAQQYIDLINQTLQNEVIPNIDSGDKLTIPKNPQNPIKVGSKHIETISRKIKSQEHSFEHRGTPSTAKCFFSKCQSPSSRKRNSNSNSIHCCSIHHSEPITHMCLTCDIKPLCIKCVSSSKRHYGHDLKQMGKTIALLSEQLSINMIQVNNKIEEMELFQRRLDDRTNVIKDRGTKYLTQIRDSFAEAFHKLQQKQQQVIRSCQDHFAGLIQHINDENQKVNDCMDMLKSFKQKIAVIQRSSGGLDLVNKYNYLKKQLTQQCNLNQMEFYLQKKFQMPSSSVKRQITEISQKISAMKVNFKYTNFCRIGASELQNCTSEGKLKKDSAPKRVKTNFGSLNSSREKRDKKYTKTEEDQKRLKNQRSSKNSDQKKNKIPTYISDFINKKSSKMGSDGSSYNMEMTSPNYQNASKLTSKLSKTISPQDIIRKKKQHHAAIKERIERKTTQPTRTSSKKKKHH